MTKEILRLAVPSIISNITVPLLGLVDVAITGHMGDARYLAAIAVGSMVFNLIYWLFSFLRFGTGGMTAQAYGAEDMTECCHILLRALFTCAMMALALLALQVPIFSLTMWLIAPDDSLLNVIRTYYGICIWGTLPSLSLYALTGWFVGMQNTTMPMVVSITQNIANILLSTLFVYSMGMKIEGVALGTLLAQWASMLMAIALLSWRYGKLWQGVKWRGAVKWHDLRRFFSVNSTLFYRTLFLVAVNLWFIVAGAKGGAEILSVNAVLMQMFILYTYVMDGFAFAAEALCGRFHGAGEKRWFCLALRGIWRFSLILTIAYAIAYGVGGNAFLRLLTDDEGVRIAAMEYMPWAVLIPLCGIAAFVWDGVFVGITNTRGMLWGTFCGATAFFVIYFALCPLMHNHALWLAFNAYLLMRGVTQHIIWRRDLRDRYIS